MKAPRIIKHKYYNPKCDICTFTDYTKRRVKNEKHRERWICEQCLNDKY